MRLFQRSKKTRAEEERVIREEANSVQKLLQLPAELRNQIYDHCIQSGKPSSRKWYVHYRRQLPSLLHVCRKTRAEVFPIWFGNNLITIQLQHLTLHQRSTLRIQSSVNLLPDSGTDVWRMIKLESNARCFHSDGFAMLAKVDVFIDRNQGSADYLLRGSPVLGKCCQSSQREYGERLCWEVRSCGFHQKERKLRRQDFERLARRMDESRSDWPMSPRRVVPRREMR